MIVVADTSPLNYLIQIECDRLLPALYRRILVPPAVIREMEHAHAPPAVASWLQRTPAWIEISAPAVLTKTWLDSPGFESLGAGEREAIQLAEEQSADLLLIDERKGTLEAGRRGLETTGTLGVLLSAGLLGLVDAEAGYRRLIEKTNFRSSDALERHFLRQIRLS